MTMTDDDQEQAARSAAWDAELRARRAERKAKARTARERKPIIAAYLRWRGREDERPGGSPERRAFEAGWAAAAAKRKGEKMSNHDDALAALRAQLADLQRHEAERAEANEKLYAQLAALRKAAARLVLAHKRWEKSPTSYMAQMVLEARDELAALDAAGSPQAQHRAL